MDKVIAFVPCRKGSQRVVNKNIKPFSGVNGGLTFIKISQLLKVDSIDKIVISTDDDEVKRIARSFEDPKILIDNRPAQLASSETSTDDLIQYIPTIIQSSTILWTHVTSPMVNEAIYEKMINAYFENLDDFDSLMSITKCYKFMWYKGHPLNYDKNIEKWPRTQTLSPLLEINSAAFIANIDIYHKYNDRIGDVPFLYELNEIESFDIDWEIDFELAEVLWCKHEKI